jgi:hypothetical protein
VALGIGPSDARKDGPVPGMRIELFTVSVTYQSDHDCIVKFADEPSVDVHWFKDTRTIGHQE